MMLDRLVSVCNHCPLRTPATVLPANSSLFLTNSTAPAFRLLQEHVCSSTSKEDEVGTNLYRRSSALRAG
jgi:hypothetical protein